MENLSKLSEQLMQLPDQIAGRQNELIDMNQRLQSVEDQILQKESELRQDIAGTVDTAGKKVYANQEARDAAFVAESKSDHRLTDLYKQRDDQRRELAAAKTEIERLGNHQRNLRSVLFALAGQREDVLNS